MTLNPRAHHGAESLSAQAKRGVLPVDRPAPREKASRRSLRPMSAKAARARRKAQREAIYVYAALPEETPACWLTPFSVKERSCEGRMDHAHLIDKAVLKREGFPQLCVDERTWVWACRWHHTQFDHRFGVIVPRSALPVELEKLCEEIGLGWWLDRRYGEPVRAVA